MPAEPEPAEPAVAPVVEAPRADEMAVEPAPVPAQAGEPAAGGRGKHARSATSYVGVLTRDEAESAALETRAAEMLAILAAESSNPLGPLADRLESTASRVVACVFAAVVLVLAVLLVMTLLGHFI